jgi:predicted oxidoreductase (fatty acid repression mutant protein)
MTEEHLIRHTFPVTPTAFVSQTEGAPLTYNKQQQTPWPLVRERIIPSERPPLFDEI